MKEAHLVLNLCEGIRLVDSDSSWYICIIDFIREVNDVEYYAIFERSEVRLRS